MIILKEVIRKNRLAVLLFFVTTAVNTTVFILYDILAEPLLYAAVLAVYLHGLAADTLAGRMGLAGILPRDIPEILPEILKKS